MKLTDDIKPIYLGYDKAQNKYYFYFIKEGAPRFLSYVTYFYWDRGPQEALTLVPVPENIEEELQQFLAGELQYEFVKVRKNSRKETVKKVYRLPQQVGQDAPSMGGIRGTTRNTGDPVLRSSGITGNVAGNSDGPSLKPKRKRRTKAEMVEAKKLLEIPVVDVVAVSSEVINVRKKRKPKTTS